MSTQAETFQNILLDWKISFPSSEISKFKEYLKSRGGIYLWIFDGKPPRVCYIGEAKNFYDRYHQSGHISNFRKAAYTIFNIDKSQDWLKFVAENLHGKSMKEIVAGGLVRNSNTAQADNQRFIARGQSLECELPTQSHLCLCRNHS